MMTAAEHSEHQRLGSYECLTPLQRKMVETVYPDLEKVDYMTHYSYIHNLLVKNRIPFGFLADGNSDEQKVKTLLEMHPEENIVAYYGDDKWGTVCLLAGETLNLAACPTVVFRLNKSWTPNIPKEKTSPEK